MSRGSISSPRRSRWHEGALSPTEPMSHSSPRICSPSRPSVHSISSSTPVACTRWSAGAWPLMGTRSLTGSLQEASSYSSTGASATPSIGGRSVHGAARLPPSDNCSLPLSSSTSVRRLFGPRSPLDPRCVGSGTGALGGPVAENGLSAGERTGLDVTVPARCGAIKPDVDSSVVESSYLRR
jgi:hypothetical protein